MAEERGGARRGLAPEMLAELVEVAPAALLVTDALGVVHLCNRAAAALVGVPAGVVLGRPLGKTLPGLVGGPVEHGRGRVDVEVVEFGEWRVLALRATGSRARTAALRLRPGRVLVVGDNRVTQRVTVVLLGRLGLRCEVATDVAGALEKIAEIPFDVVLMDIRVPGLAGLDVPRALRAAEEPRRSLPVVVALSDAAIEHRQTCFAAGIDACVAKPITPTELQGVLARWLAAADVGPLDDAALAELEGELGTQELQQLVDRLLGQVRKDLVDLASLAAAGEVVGVGGRAHALVGAAGALGVVGVAAAARELERVCRWPAPAYVGEAVAGLEQAARAAESALAGWFGRVPETG